MLEYSHRKSIVNVKIYKGKKTRLLFYILNYKEQTKYEENLHRA